MGRITRINGLLWTIIDAGVHPRGRVGGAGEDGGSFNVNADVVAGHVAGAIGAHKIVFLTDVDGLYENFENKDSLISNLTLFEAQYMAGNIVEGMIPKLNRACTRSRRGVPRAHHQRHHAAFAAA